MIDGFGVEFRGLVSSLRELIRVLKEMLVILKRQFPEPVDQTKLGKISFAAIAPVDVADCIITDLELDETWRAELDLRKIRYLYPNQ